MVTQISHPGTGMGNSPEELLRILEKALETAEMSGNPEVVSLLRQAKLTADALVNKSQGRDDVLQDWLMGLRFVERLWGLLRDLFSDF